MKKHNVNSLYIIEIQHDKFAHYIIGEYHEKENTFIDLFSNTKIDVTDTTMIEPLCDYKHYFTKNDQISKREILTLIEKIKEIIDLEKHTYFTELGINIDLILETAIHNFFPTLGIWSSECFNKSSQLSMINLPCHLRDDLWLAKMLKHNQSLLFINTSVVLDYIKKSELFQEKRHEYELELVKWQIDWMINGGENWIIDGEDEIDFVMINPDCDLAFRKGVVDTLSKIGLDREVIEEGLEIFADMWRDGVMLRAFINEYEPTSIMASLFPLYNTTPLPKNLPIVRLELSKREHKENWLRLRKYEYYQRHKDSVDKYGIVEPDMLLSNEELAELKGYLEIKNSERKAQLEHYNQEMNNNGQSRILKKDSDD